MSNNKFGKELYVAKTTTANLWKKRLLFFILLLLSGFGSLYFAWFFDEYNIFFLIVCMIATIILTVYTFFRIGHSEARLYDNGFIYTYNRDTDEILFDDVKGMFILYIRLHPNSNHRIDRHVADIFMKNGEELGLDLLASAELPSFRKFNELLDNAYSDYVLQGAAFENLNNFNISFGDNLELRNGLFVHNGKMLSVYDARDVVISQDRHGRITENSVLTLSDKNGNEFASINILEMLNIQILRRIVRIV
jgi:hypothetical protein